MVEERTRKTIEHGRRIRAVLTQPQFAPLSLGEQVALLLAVRDGILDALPLEKIEPFRSGLRDWLSGHCPDALTIDDKAKHLDEALAARLAEALKALAQTLAGA